MNETVPEQENSKENTKPISSNSPEFTAPQKFPQSQPSYSKENQFNYNQFPVQEDPSSGFYNFFDYNQQNRESPDYSPYYYQPNTYFSNFPRARDYNDDGSIIEAFPHLKGYNDTNFNIDSVESDDYFFIMRSSNDDNIHKAIKYHVWTSTPASNMRLQEAWIDANNPSKPKPNKVYLIFSVVNSYQFMGVAELLNPPNKDLMFNYWWEPRKWYGTFDIKWIYIKDVPYKKFEHIKEESQTVTTCKDCTRLSAKSGKQIMGIFKSSSNKPNIFEAFEYMDNRENILRLNRDRDPSLSDPSQRSNYKGGGGYNQRRPWKPQGGYKRFNEMNPRKYGSRPYYSDNAPVEGGYGGDDGFFPEYYQNEQYDYAETNPYGYNKGAELNTLGAPSNSRVSSYGYNKNYTGGYAGGQMGAFAEGNSNHYYTESNQNSRPTGHYVLKTNSNEFHREGSEDVALEDKFVVKSGGQKSAEKKKKLKKQLNEGDKVDNTFFDQKPPGLNQIRNVIESDDDRKEKKN